MSAESFTDRIIHREISLAILVGVLLYVSVATITVILQWARWIDMLANLTEIWMGVASFVLGVGTTLITQGLLLQRRKIAHPLIAPATESEKALVPIEKQSAGQYDGLFDEDVSRNYDIRVLKFDIKSTTSWFELGLRDSRKLTIQESNATKGKIRSLDLNADLAGQYFHVDHAGSPKLEVAITATFEVYSAQFVIAFLRKGDEGELTVQILDDEGRKVGDRYSYSRHRFLRNHVEFGRYFS